MDEAQRKEIEEVINQFKCPKDYKCYKSGLETLCKAKYLETSSISVLVCLEIDNKKCKFLNIKGGWICECPLRAYIAKKLKK